MTSKRIESNLPVRLPRRSGDLPWAAISAWYFGWSFTRRPTVAVIFIEDKSLWWGQLKDPYRAVKRKFCFPRMFSNKKFFLLKAEWLIQTEQKNLILIFDKRRKKWLFMSLPGMKHLFVCVFKKAHWNPLFMCFRCLVKHLQWISFYKALGYIYIYI